MTRGKLLLGIALATVVAGCAITQAKQDGPPINRVSIDPVRAGIPRTLSAVGLRHQGTAPRVLASLDATVQVALMSTVIIPPTPHACNVCVLDTPLTDPACAACRNAVSTYAPDPWCSTTGWDRTCMNEALALCPAGSFTCTCPHGVAQTGQWLHPACVDPTTGSNTCVNAICQADSFCQTSSWDATCVQEASTCQ